MPQVPLMSLFRVVVAETPVFSLSSIHLVPVERGWGAHSWRNEVAAHRLVRAFGYRALGFSCG